MYALGDAILVPLFQLISVHNLALFTIGTLVAERSYLSFPSLSRSLLDIVKQLVKNPITGSLIAGIFINISGMTIYAPVEESFILLSNAAIPSALFMLAASLNKYQIICHFPPAPVIVILKVTILPLIVWVLAFHVFILDPMWAATALLTSAKPVGISAYVFSESTRFARLQSLRASWSLRWVVF